MKTCRRPLALACLFALLLSSCAKDGGEAAEPPREEAPVYLLIPKEKYNPYMIKMYEGFADACEEIGAVARFGEISINTAQAQIDLIDRAVGEGTVDAIAVAANDAAALSDALQRAREAGIQIVSLDSAVLPQDRMVHIQQASPEIIGRALIQSAARMIGGEGVAGLISTTELATNQNLWIRWMREELASNPERYANFTLLDPVYGNDLPDDSRQAAIGLLDSHPEIDVIIVPSVVGMLAVGEVLAERNSDIIFTGLGLPSEIAPYIEDGSCPWMYLWNPFSIGYLAAYAVNALISQTISGSQGDAFPAGSLGQRIVTDGADGGTEVVLGDPMKFDADNIEQWKLVY